MRVAIISVLLAAAAVGANGLAPQRQVLVTYPKDTPESTIDNAKDAIKIAVCTLCSMGELMLKEPFQGGQITAEFSKRTTWESPLFSY